MPRQRAGAVRCRLPVVTNVGTVDADQAYEVGRYYRVPCVRGRWILGDSPLWIPVIGPLHEDTEYIGFPFQHWHVDYRFLRKWERDRVREPVVEMDDPISGLFPRRIYAEVMLAWNIQPEGHDRTLGGQDRTMYSPDANRMRRFQEFMLPARSPDWFRTERRRCGEQYPPYDYVPRWLEGLESRYRDTVLKDGMICPHRGADLSKVEPDSDGTVVCPLLRSLLGGGFRKTAAAGRRPRADPRGLRNTG